MTTLLTILVTGGAGYIGSHTALALLRQGHQIIILDNLVYGHRQIVESVLKTTLIVGDIRDRSLLDQIFQKYRIDAVLHFAAYAYVGESVQRPDRYYRNNVAGTLTLLEAMVTAGIKNIVFSSTCATYGIPEKLPIAENNPQNPINPYGRSKLMIEFILKDFERAYGLKFVIFRYFNAAGADPSGLLGENHQPETHLIPLVLLTALEQYPYVSIFGTDYPTPDGTCTRDYIHVNDLATAHLLGLSYLLEHQTSEVFNLGNGDGFSVKKVIETCQEITGKIIPLKAMPRRAGDPPILVGSSEKVSQYLGWYPRYSLQDIVNHAWVWHQNSLSLA